MATELKVTLRFVLPQLFAVLSVSIARIAVAVLSVAVLSGCASTAEQTRELLLRQAAANTAYQEDDCERAIALYRDLADDLTGNTESLLRIGNCMARNQQWGDAALAYREALQRDPTFGKAWYNLSYVQARILGETVVEMTRYMDPTDPAAEQLRRMAEEILQAFDLSLPQSQSKLQSSDPGEQTENSGDEH